MSLIKWEAGASLLHQEATTSNPEDYSIAPPRGLTLFSTRLLGEGVERGGAEP